MKEWAKTYDPKAMEDRIYGEWLEKKYFHAEVDRSKKPFTIVMPPPNITGKLHMGHALDNTLQDILIRYKRMQGYNALWIPGTDHASISTEVKVINQLKSEGIDKNELGREGFLKRTWEWREEYGRTIVDQLKKIGSSCDWDRERFTMDEGCSKAVQEVFLRLHKKGYIYKGSRIINWCPVCKTSISDAEVEHEEQAGHFWHINYPIKGSDKFVEIATTRPETLLGDSALAVNPDDERYKDIVGKTVILPLVGREIPVIADAYVDKEFGTGVVKITPAHDPNDFEVGKRHNLPEINILNDDATINENGGKYAGMDRYEARKVMVEELKEQGLLVKVADHVHNVGTHDRCGTTVEPMIKQQWFVKMEEMAKPAIEAVKNGDLTFVPERFDKTYLHWLENIRDWCISRQLWWGHRIPAYYCDDCGEIVVDREMPSVCPKCGGTHFTQDPDTLDTWFSSALWPFSTLGWPENTEDLDYFYPTDVLVTGYDIIFFWVIRMVFSGYEQTGKCPFHHVLIHGLVRDSLGRKMSKSLGNGIDPLEIIDQYGADALRFTLVTGNAPGNDMRFYMERVEASRNFANKIWNASRFIMMNVTALKENEHEQSEYSFSTEQSATDRRSGACVKEMDLTQLTGADKWILSKVNTLAQDVTANMDKFELGIAVQKLYDFIWDDYCDWYIELTKTLKLLHPYMPFITEEIYRNLTGEESIMISAWPEFKAEWSFQKEEAEVELIKEAVRSIRNVRSSMNVPPSKKAHVIVVSEKPQVREVFEGSKAFFGTLSYASQVTVQEDKSGIGEDAVSALIPDAAVYMPFAELVDLEKEIERLKKEEERLTKELARVNGMLSNEKFISKAPQSKIDEEKEKLEKYTQMMNQVKEHLAALVK